MLGDYDFYFDFDIIVQFVNVFCFFKLLGVWRIGLDVLGDNYYIFGFVELVIEYFCNEYVNKDDIVCIFDFFLVVIFQDDYLEY